MKKQQIETMKMLSYAFIGSGILYGIVLHFTKNFVLDFQLLSQSLAERPLYSILVLYSVLMMVFAKKISNVIFDVSIKNLKARSAESVHQAYFSSFIVKNTMIESGILFSFALSFLIKEATLFVIMYVIGAILIYKGIPDEASVKQDLQKFQL